MDRDDPEVLFGALRELRESGLQVRLGIIGRFNQNPQGKVWFQRIDSDDHLRGIVDFIGEVGDAELQGTLISADGLILTRRNSIDEVTSFPTRLVECLKVGRPVFVSAVGDIPLFLSDKRHAVLLPPGNVYGTAMAIRKILCSADRGHQIGIRGRRHASECFDRRLHAKRVLEFGHRIRAWSSERAD